MRPKFLRPCLLGSCAMLLGAAAPPQPAPGLLYRLKTILVSVSPFAQGGLDIRKFPHPVQTITHQDITAEGVANATQALAARGRGVNLVNSQANPYQPTILYHGFEISPIQGTPAGLSVYVDGARFNTPFGDLAIWSLLPDEAIDRLSLQDGNPVFGLNALGGAINVTMKNGFTAQGGQAELSGGSFDQLGANLEYGKQSGNAAAYIDLNETHEAGWRDLQSSDIQNFYGDLGWRGARAELHINATLANSDLNGPGTVPVQLLDADPAAQFTGPNSITDKYAKLGATFADHLTDATTLQAVLYYDNLHESLVNGNGPNDLPCGPGADPGYLCQGGAGGAPSTAAGGGLIPNFMPNANAYGYYSYAQLNLNTSNTNGYGGSAELTNTSPLWGLPNHAIAGLSYDGGFTSYGAAGYVGAINSQSRVYYTPAGIPSPGYELDEPGTVPVDVVIRNAYEGAYALDSLSLTQRLTISAGARFNIANLALHDQLPPDPNAAGGGLTGRHFYDHLNPALGATYDLGAVTLYGGVSEQNATPTPAELSCASPADSCSLANFESGDPGLKQITTTNWEAGLRGSRGAFSYNADVYDSTTRDDIEFLQSPYNPAGQGYFSNVGNVRRMGIDAGLNASLGTWQIFADYSWINATYQSSFIEQSNNPNADSNGNITVEPGDHLPGIPQNIIKFGATDQITPAWQLGLSATAQTSEYLYGDEANLTAPLPGYIVLDVTSAYQLTPRLKFFGGIDNLTDTKYYNYGTFSPTGQDGGVYVAQAPNYNNPRSYSLAAPISVYAGVDYKF